MMEFLPIMVCDGVWILCDRSNVYIFLTVSYAGLRIGGVGDGVILGDVFGPRRLYVSDSSGENHSTEAKLDGLAILTQC
jgi:hypothetical protein